MKKILYSLIAIQCTGLLIARFPENAALTRAVAKTVTKDQNKFSCGVSSSDCECSSSSDCASCAPTPIVQTDFVFRAGDEIKARQTGFLLLTAAGIYCLAEDVTGSILVQGNSITIDLNGHALSGFAGNDGIAISNGSGVGILTDVRIKNGFLNGPAATLVNAGNGVSVDDSNILGVHIEDVVITEWTNGISGNSNSPLTIARVLSADNLNDGLLIGLSGQEVINTALVVSDSQFIGNGNNGAEVAIVNASFTDCLFDNNGTDGMLLNDSLDVDFLNCQALNNDDSGFVVQDSSIVNYNNCVANANAGQGFYVTGIEGESTAVYFYSCAAHYNSNGFLSELSSDGNFFQDCVASHNNAGFILDKFVSSGTFINCSAQENVNGFLIQGFSANTIIRDCTASNNNTGFIAAGIAIALTIENCMATGNPAAGFQLQVFLLTANAIVRGCTAHHNGVGFTQDGTATGKANYYSNVSCFNGVNYAGGAAAGTIAASQNTALPFQNVTCP